MFPSLEYHILGHPTCLPLTYQALRWATYNAILNPSEWRGRFSGAGRKLLLCIYQIAIGILCSPLGFLFHTGAAFFYTARSWSWAQAEQKQKTVDREIAWEHLKSGVKDLCGAVHVRKEFFWDDPETFIELCAPDLAINLSLLPEFQGKIFPVMPGHEMEMELYLQQRCSYKTFVWAANQIWESGDRSKPALNSSAVIKKVFEISPYSYARLEEFRMHPRCYEPIELPSLPEADRPHAADQNATRKKIGAILIVAAVALGVGWLFTCACLAVGTGAIVLFSMLPLAWPALACATAMSRTLWSEAEEQNRRKIRGEEWNLALQYGDAGRCLKIAHRGGPKSQFCYGIALLNQALPRLDATSEFQEEQEYWANLVLEGVEWISLSRSSYLDQANVFLSRLFSHNETSMTPFATNPRQRLLAIFRMYPSFKEKIEAAIKEFQMDASLFPPGVNSVQWKNLIIKIQMGVADHLKKRALDKKKQVMERHEAVSVLPPVLNNIVAEYVEFE